VTAFDEAWSVSQLARTIKRRVEEDFPSVWVRGEVVGVKKYPSGHLYFSLRDSLAKVDCTMWRSAAGKLKAPLDEGTEVFALGTAAVWEERTSLRFNVVQVLPAAGIGAQAQALERIKAALLADGLLDPGRKRPLPSYASRIAVVTSLAGAAVQDIITVARRRWPAVELLIVNSAVQGENAPAELVRALRIVAQLDDLDCCIVGRGGGSKEDLAAFNDEAVCRAIAATPVPVICAVGHEVDVTLADLVADVRAATPSQAAEFALPDRAEVRRRVTRDRSALIAAMTRTIGATRDRLDRTRDRMGGAVMERRRQVERRLMNARARLAPALTRAVARPREQLTRLRFRLEPAVSRLVAARRADLSRLAAQLDALSPVAVLGRGYAVARGEDGKVLGRISAFAPGMRFTLTVSDGEISARTEER
jgi:exodeoxyribonuclease VII large subunit